MRTTARTAWMIAMVVTVWCRPAPAQQSRPLHPEDVIRRERLNSLLSPDGKALLYWRLTQFVQPGPRFFVVNPISGEERELDARSIPAHGSPRGRGRPPAGGLPSSE